MFGNIGDLAKLMKTANDMRKNMEKLKGELATAEFTAGVAGDAVRATVTGDFRIKEIAVSPEAGSDPAALAALCADAVNAAIATAKVEMRKKMSAMTGGLDLPELF